MLLNRKFIFEPLVIIPGAVLALKGKVTNTGDSSWDNLSEKEGMYFRVGFRIYQEGECNAVIFESRFFFDQKVVAQGGSIEFNTAFNISVFAKGRYVLFVNIVRESSFWFDDKGISSEQIKFEVEEPKKSNICTSQILFILPSVPQYDRSSGENRLFEIIKLCKRHKLKIKILAERELDYPEAKKYYKAIKPLVVNYFEDQYSFWKDFKREKFSHCVISWYKLAEKYLGIFHCCMPEVKLIVDSVDVHWLRQERGVARGILTIDKKILLNEKEEEKKVYQSANEVWAVTQEDKNYILKELPDSQVRVVSNIHRKDRWYNCNLANKNGIIFVGSFNHPPNQSAALWGYDIFQEFCKKTQYRPLHYIVGDNPPEELRRLHDGQRIIVTGFVENLHNYYKQSRVMIAPIKYGAGIKGKICHAICNGLPVITTDAGNEGLGLIHGKEVLIANTTDEFVQCLEVVFSGKIDLKNINRMALRKVLEKTSEKIVWKSIAESLDFNSKRKKVIRK